jgi:lysophospholipase L1-like esterase
MLVHVARIALAPLLYAQARRMRATTPELPEPEGERHGVVGTGEPALRLLIAGDSSAVGVGAATQEDGFALPLTRAVAARLRAPVQWQLIGKTGFTSLELLEKLKASELQPADMALIIIGTNDITCEVPLRRALRHRAEIIQHLRAAAGVRQVFFPSLVEMQRFPAIPQPLAWYAGLHARRNNRVQLRWTRRHENVHYADIGGLTRSDLMARDGYHPAPRLYSMIAERMADHVHAVVRVQAQAAARVPAVEAFAPVDLMPEPELDVEGAR